VQETTIVTLADVDSEAIDRERRKHVAEAGRDTPTREALDLGTKRRRRRSS